MYSSQSGQTLLELVAVITVIVIVVVALTFATIASLRNSQFARDQAQATKFAQEGIERVRAGRDRNQCINSLDPSVGSWNGSNPDCIAGANDSIWGYQIQGNCSTALTPDCYFKVNDKGILTGLGAYPSSKFPQDAEPLPSTEGAQFSRAVILSDDPTSASLRKTVTVVVRWVDFAGNHESRLQTILRNATTP